MSSRYEFFRQSNLIEEVDEEDAVRDNIAAYEYLRDEAENGELTHELVKRVHEIILEDRQPEIAGEYKEKENFVYVGRQIKVFCPPEKVEQKMTELLDITPETPLEALKWHATAANIHPFLDGNGRALRVIYYWHVKDVIQEKPLTFYADSRHGYYSLLKDESDMLLSTEIEFRDLKDEISAEDLEDL